MTDKMDLASIRDRVDSRLLELGVTAHAASVRAGLPDALRNLRRAAHEGRPTVTIRTLHDAAKALKCDVNWLITGKGSPDEGMAAAATPAPAAYAGPATGPIHGVLAAGVWIEEKRRKPLGEAFLMPGYPAEQQSLWKVSGEDMAAKRVHEGDLVAALPTPSEMAPIRTGSLVIVQRERGGLIESTLREVEIRDGRVSLHARPVNPEEDEPPTVLPSLDGASEDGAHIVGIVVGAYRHFI